MSNPFKRLLSSSLIYGLGTVLVQLINIILMPLLTEHLSPRQYGEIAILNFAYLFAVAIFSLGVGVSLGVCYYDYEKKEERDSLVWSGFIVSLLSCAVYWIIGISLIDIWCEWLVGRIDAKGIVISLLIASTAHILATPFEAKLRLDERPKIFILIAFLTTFSIGIPTLLFVIWLDRGVGGYFEALALGRVISLVLNLLATNVKSSRDFDFSKARKLVVHGIPVVVQFFFLYFLQYGNIDGLRRFLGLEASGIYSVGLTVGMAINVVISSISNAWAPFFLSYVKNLNEARVLFGRITTYYVFGVGMLSLCFYYFSQPLVILLSAEGYAESATIVGPLATGFFLLGLYNMLLPPIFFAKEMHIPTYLLALSSLALVGFGFFMIPSLGLQGAAWASVISYLVLDALLLIWNRMQGERYFQIQYETYRNAVFGLFYIASILILSAIHLESALQTGMLYFGHSVLMILLILALLEPEERIQISPVKLYGYVVRLSGRASES